MIDRLQAWFSACVREAVKSLPYAGEYRYSVVSCDFAGQTLDCKALDAGQPSLTRVPMRAPGMRLDVAPGAEVLIGYAGLDGTRPEVRCYSQQPGAILRVELLGGTTPVALQGMEITITPTQFAAATPTSPSGSVTTSSPMKGTITGGSATIKGTA
jgi:hypothetical protein